MKLEEAPFFTEIVEPRIPTRAYWIRSADGAKCRLAQWGPGKKGTILLFNGRTEYIEKYAAVACEFRGFGFAVVVNDWRGHGLADRFASDPATCHVGDFEEYQLDVKAMLSAVDQLGLPRPYFLLAHSMGGCIGLRSLCEGIDVCSAVFLGPMWNILRSPAARIAAALVSTLAVNLGFSKRFVPGTDARNYLQKAKSNGNLLTSDPEMFDYLHSQIEMRPELALGGPSNGWLRATLREIKRLEQLPLPDVPSLTLMGSKERVVDSDAIRATCDRWDSADLEIVHNAKHELLMERHPVRGRVTERTVRFFESTRNERN